MKEVKSLFLEASRYYEPIEEDEPLDEKLIGFKGRGEIGARPSGEFVMMAGAPGSGKGWVKNNVIKGSENFKSVDVDDIKKLMIKLFKRWKMSDTNKIPSFGKKQAWKDFVKQQGTDRIDVDNPEHVEYLEKQAKQAGIEEKYFDEVVIPFFRDAKEGNIWTDDKWNLKFEPHVSLLHAITASYDFDNIIYKKFFKSQKEKEEKDNLIADITGDKMEVNLNLLSNAKEAGFRTTLVYVMTDKETAWYNNIVRDRRVSQKIFADKHAKIPDTIKEMLREKSKYLDRAFIVFSTPRGEGIPIIDLAAWLPPANFFPHLMKPKEGETKEEFKERQDDARKKLNDHKNRIQAIRNMAYEAGLSVKELLSKLKGTHAPKSPLEYGDVVELEKEGDNFILPEEISDRIDDIIQVPADYSVKEKGDIPKEFQKLKSWDYFLFNDEKKEKTEESKKLSKADYNKMKSSFQDQYGDEWESVFYAYLNKNDVEVEK